MHRISRNAAIVWAVIVVPAAITTRRIEAPDEVGADVDGAAADPESRGFDVTVVGHEPPGTRLESALVPPGCASEVGTSVVVVERAWRFALLPIKDWVVLYVCEVAASRLIGTASSP